ncbi:MAG: cytochrome c [Ilumatobacteraceae bacterium]|nr:cytochrome c [Ilumatobacteraceae bacterium]
MNRTITSLAALGLALLPACGSNDSAAEIDLPPAAAEGRDVFRSNGCAACHGSDAGGGVGPPLAGLFGTEASIQGQDPVVADRAYLVESIVDPGAKLVEGYNLPMPTTNLSDTEVDQLVAYIEALAVVTP